MIQVGIHVTYFGPLRQMIYKIILGFAQIFIFLSENVANDRWR